LAATLVAFVSTNTAWNSQPMSISGLTDNMGNNWSVLAGSHAVEWLFDSAVVRDPILLPAARVRNSELE